MRKSIKISATCVILLLMSFTIYGQTDYWSGQWNTKYGKVTITKNGTSYTGSFPNGKIIEGREQDGMLLGRYTYRSRTRSSLGMKGEYRFILSADKTKFDGYHKSQTDRKWGSENWDGEKVWGTVMPVIVSNNISTVVTPTWTGTWETKTADRFKILDTGNKKKEITVVIAKISIKRNGNRIEYYDVDGYFNKKNPRVFEGTLSKNNVDVGFITLEYGSLNYNDCTGYMWFGKDNSKYNISAHRTSSAKPNMNTY